MMGLHLQCIQLLILGVIFGITLTRIVYKWPVKK